MYYPGPKKMDDHPIVLSGSQKNDDHPIVLSGSSVIFSQGGPEEGRWIRSGWGEGEGIVENQCALRVDIVTGGDLRQRRIED